VYKKEYWKYSYTLDNSGSPSVEAKDVWDVNEPVGDERPVGREYFIRISSNWLAAPFKTHTL